MTIFPVDLKKLNIGSTLFQCKTTENVCNSDALLTIYLILLCQFYSRFFNLSSGLSILSIISLFLCNRLSEHMHPQHATSQPLDVESKMPFLARKANETTRNTFRYCKSSKTTRLAQTPVTYQMTEILCYESYPSRFGVG